MAKKSSAKPAAKKVGKVVKATPAKSGSNKSARFKKAKANMKTEDDLINLVAIGLEDEMADLGF